jgi:hypothetical protein
MTQPAKSFPELSPMIRSCVMILPSAILAALYVGVQGLPSCAEEWQAGAAQIKITPPQPMWMSGYSSRDKPAEGTLTDLWAKALVLEDPKGERAAMISLDLVGIDRATSLAIRRELKARFQLELRQTALFCSHTHTGPVVGTNLAPMYFLDEDQMQRVAQYTARLQEDVVAVVGEALKSLAPARLDWGTGSVDFAVNRRENPEAEVPRLRELGQLRGPVDHHVPVLRVTSPDGKLRAVLFGYACHATVLSFYQWSGDYPGFAMLELEKAHPGAVAMFFAGCGADQNPLPRRTVELAQAYGGRLARAVQAVLQSEMRPIGGQLSASYEEIELPFAEIPTREQLEEQFRSTDKFIGRRADLLLQQLARYGRLSPTYPYPVQCFRLGPELLFVTLGGEVVVDFSLRLKEELGRDTTWVAAYTNDVMAYIPSRRVLLEGRYEGGGAMVYYGLPSSWAPEVEELIVRAVQGLARPRGGE